ncbi:MAG: GyrI-like domain-containing protein [Mycobacteriaceae bacterium]
MSYEVTLVDLPEQPAAVIRGHVGHDGIGEFLGPAFGEVMGLLQRQGLQPSGAPFGRYRPAANEEWDIEAGFPASGTPSAEGRVEQSSLPGGRAARTMHVGDYSAIGPAYAAVAGWLSKNGYVPAGEPWECYLDGPEVTKPRTEVFFPCRQAA